MSKVKERADRKVIWSKLSGLSLALLTDRYCNLESEVRNLSHSTMTFKFHLLRILAFSLFIALISSIVDRGRTGISLTVSLMLAIETLYEGKSGPKNPEVPPDSNPGTLECLAVTLANSPKRSPLWYIDLFQTFKFWILTSASLWILWIQQYLNLFYCLGFRRKIGIVLPKILRFLVNKSKHQQDNTWSWMEGLIASLGQTSF